MNTHTIRLHRVLKAKPELVYKAFLDPDALARWLPPNGYLCKVFHLDAKVGGTFKMAFTQFSNGHTHSFGGEYLELVPNERLRYTDVFDYPNLPGTIEVTVNLKAVSCGTELNVTQAGVPAVIPEEAVTSAGRIRWQYLANLVEGGPPAGGINAIFDLMAYDTSIADRVTDMLTARRVTFHTKAMFGGLCFMVNDKMCLGVLKAELMVRLDPAVHEAALKQPGCSPMEFTGRSMKGFVFVQAAHLDSEEQLQHWVNLALEFNPRAAISKRRSKRSQ